MFDGPISLFVAENFLAYCTGILGAKPYPGFDFVLFIAPKNRATFQLFRISL
jgi:hypothetical protein